MITKTAVTSTYEDVEDLCNSLAWKAYKSFGGSYEEWQAESYYGFMKAYKAFDLSKGIKFVTYAYTAIWNTLLDLQDDRIKKLTHEKNILDVEDDEEESIEPAQETRSLVERILSEVSEDGRVIVSLIFETPAELKGLLSSRKPVESRKQLWHYLRKFGWTMARVVTAFTEVREVLSNGVA